MKRMFGRGQNKGSRTEPTFGVMREQKRNSAELPQDKSEQPWNYDRLGRDVVSASHNNVIVAILFRKQSTYVDWVSQNQTVEATG